MDVANRIRIDGASMETGQAIMQKGKCYSKVVKPALLYGSECWTVSKSQEQRMQVAVVRSSGGMCTSG